MKYHDTQQDTQMLFHIDLMLTTAQATALARYLKRLDQSDFRASAVDDGEAKEVQAGVDALRTALAEAGF